MALERQSVAPVPRRRADSIHRRGITTSDYLAGANGALLFGNAQEGFITLSADKDKQNFTGAAWLDGTLFLAASDGLYHYDA